MRVYELIIDTEIQLRTIQQNACIKNNCVLNTYFDTI